MSGKLLTTGQVARLLDVSEDRVRQLANTQELKCTRTRGGHRRFPEAQVLQYQQRTGQRARAHALRLNSPRRPPEPPRSEDLGEDLEDMGFADDDEEEWPVRPVQPPPRPVAVLPLPVSPARTEPDDHQRREQEAKTEAARLQGLKQVALSSIPWDMPDAWRVQAVEELEKRITSAGIPAWMSEFEQKRLARAVLERVAAGWREEVEQERRARDAEAKREVAKAEAEEEDRRRVQELVDHGRSYAEKELREFDVRDRWQIRSDVEQALREEAEPDWAEEDVEDTVDEILEEWDENQDE